MRCKVAEAHSAEHQPFGRFRRNAGFRPRILECAAVAVNLAVVAPKPGGDGWESNPPRTPQQRPQTVLKTAGLASTAVHQRPPEFGYYLADSKVVRPLPQLYSKLAVILAVSLAVNRSLRPAENYLIRIRWVAAGAAI